MSTRRKTETSNPTAQTQNQTNAWYGSYSVAVRKLPEDQLGGVIFGCKHNTFNECLSKQLFGLPSSHFSYVKNVKPGMPLFLFNYSDRKMHGIFEAACGGQLNIDPFAWSDNGRIKTQFPAQVRISTRTRCLPVPESQFKTVISENYHKIRHFYFELDHAQTRALISLFKPVPVHHLPDIWSPPEPLQPPTTKAYPVSGQVKSESFPKDLNQFDVSSDSHHMEPYKLIDPDSEYASTSMTSKRNLDGEASSWYNLDDDMLKEGSRSVSYEHQTVHEEQHDTKAVWQKLQDLFVSRGKEAQCSKDAVNFASDIPAPHEPQFVVTLPKCPSDSTSKGDASMEDLISLGKHLGDAELLHIICELSKRTEAMEKKLIESDREILSLKESVKETGKRVQQLECQIEKLQWKNDSSVPPLGRPHDNVEVPSIFLIGGYRGSICVSSLDSFCPTTDRLVPLRPMRSARAFAAVAALEDHIYVFGGGDGISWYHTAECFSKGRNEWISFPCLKQAKGSLGGATLNGKIFAIGGGDGSAVFSEVEMYDPALGRWIDSVSMRQNRFSPAVAELNGALHVIGGFDGSVYLQSAERYDPREGFWSLLPSMTARRGSHSVAVLGEALYAVGGHDGNSVVSTVEIFDPRANSWRVGSPFSAARGYGCAVTMNDNLYYFGGVNGAGEAVETVEVYNERQGWSISDCTSIGRRCFACAVVV
ncbi:hypothetical protein ACP4OV_022259 [Aristida adscensionis]